MPLLHDTHRYPSDCVLPAAEGMQGAGFGGDARLGVLGHESAFALPLWQPVVSPDKPQSGLLTADQHPFGLKPRRELPAFGTTFFSLMISSGYATIATIML